MTNSPTYKIIGGPSREELFDALRLRHEGRLTSFTVAPAPLQGTTGNEIRTGNLKINVMVTDIGFPGFTGTAGACWNFKAIDEHAMLGCQHLEGYIDLTKREGWLRERGIY